MSERYLFRSDWRPSRRRILLAGLLGHYAAAYCFCASTMLAGFINDLQTQGMAIFAGATWSRAFEVLWTAPVVTGLLGVWGAFLISPTLLITLPVTSWAARKLDAGAPSTMADLTGWLWTGLIERISQDRRSRTCGEVRRRTRSRWC